MSLALVIRTGARAVAVATLLGGAFVAAATSFYASPTGTSSTAPGTGTITNPWNLQTALSGPAAVHPGDTIWLRGGTYSGTFTSYLAGTASQPIIVRQYPGERAKVDGGTVNTSVLLTVWGAYTWFWGFEITSSSTDRVSTQTGSSPTDLNRPYECIANAQRVGSGVGIKIINMIIHNCGQGIGLWRDATGAEVYGNLISYNGWNAPDRNHGHGIYSQNTAPSRRTIRDNIFHANYSYNIQVYGESAHLDNHTIDGNIAFWDGAAASPPGGGASINMGGALSASGNSLTDNAFYGFPSQGLLDFSRGNQNVTMTGNMSGAPAGNGAAIRLQGQTGTVTITGNRFYGNLFQPSNYATLYPSNNWYLSPGATPSGSWILVRRNTYEAGRGHVAIFNWSGAASVPVDLSSVLSVGASYEIRNAQNIFGTPVLTGTYAGGTVSIPMAASSVETPAGAATPSSTGPEFNAFVILTLPGSPTPTPTPTVTPTRTPTSPPVSTPTPTRTPTRTPTPTPTPPPTPPPVSSAPTRFYTVSPCRVIDTRNANGPRGGPALVASGTRTFPVTGACGIPSTAKTVSVNVTVISPSAQGQLRMYPGNTGIPPTSAISFGAGQTRANNAMVVLATDGTGTIGVKNDAIGTVHLVLDVNGYFK